jgi:hypothetical protein
MKSMRVAIAASLLAILSSNLYAFEMPKEAKDNPVAQLLIQSLVECGKQKMGGEESVDVAYGMAEQANRQIVAYCKAGNKDKAYQTAQYYAATDEGKAVLACATQLKPLIDQPATQKLLGSYKQMVAEVVGGNIPQDVCAGMRNYR